MWLFALKLVSIAALLVQASRFVPLLQAEIKTRRHEMRLDWARAQATGTELFVLFCWTFVWLAWTGLTLFVTGSILFVIYLMFF
jgi:hypothetical protein